MQFPKEKLAGSIVAYNVFENQRCSFAAVLRNFMLMIHSLITTRRAVRDALYTFLKGPTKRSLEYSTCGQYSTFNRYRITRFVSTADVDLLPSGFSAKA